MQIFWRGGVIENTALKGGGDNSREYPVYAYLVINCLRPVGHSYAPPPKYSP